MNNTNRIHQGHMSTGIVSIAVGVTVMLKTDDIIIGVVGFGFVIAGLLLVNHSIPDV